MPSLPRILMVADRPDWAYDQIARFVITHLSDRFNFDLDYLLFNRREPWISLRGRLGNELLKFRFRSRRKLRLESLGYDLICYLGWYFPLFGIFKFNTRGFIQGIYTSSFPPEGFMNSNSTIEGVSDFVEKYLSSAVSLVVGSRQIYDLYKPYIENIYQATFALDDQLFFPKKRDSFNKYEFAIGWTGNPDRAFKGFYDFVIPAVKKAAKVRPGIVLKTRFKGPMSTLPDFYRQLDVLVIASNADAGPSSFLEAGLCGIPSISTRIGFPAEYLQDGINGLFVERSIEDITEKIVYLYDNRDVIASMSGQIHSTLVKAFNPTARASDWEKLFSGSLALLPGNQY